MNTLPSSASAHAPELQALSLVRLQEIGSGQLATMNV